MSSYEQVKNSLKDYLTSLPEGLHLSHHSRSTNDEHFLILQFSQLSTTVDQSEMLSVTVKPDPDGDTDQIPLLSDQSEHMSANIKPDPDSNDQPAEHTVIVKQEPDDQLSLSENISLNALSIKEEKNLCHPKEVKNSSAKDTEERQIRIKTEPMIMNPVSATKTINDCKKSTEAEPVENNTNLRGKTKSTKKHNIKSEPTSDLMENKSHNTKMSITEVKPSRRKVTPMESPLSQNCLKNYQSPKAFDSSDRLQRPWNDNPGTYNSPWGSHWQRSKKSKQKDSKRNETSSKPSERNISSNLKNVPKSCQLHIPPRPKSVVTVPEHSTFFAKMTYTHHR